jgi:hypothetical protein
VSSWEGLSDEVRGEMIRRWDLRHPHEVARWGEPEPRVLEGGDMNPCYALGCDDFAWRGYDGLCGRCYAEYDDDPPDAVGPAGEAT